MKNTIILIITAALGGCMASTPNKPELIPKSSFDQIGATVYSPNEKGWFLGRTSNKFGLVFGKKDGSPTNSTIFNTVILKFDDAKNDFDFLNYFDEKLKNNDDKNRYKILMFSSEQILFKNTACLKYQNLIEDHKNSGIGSDNFLYLKAFGYICRHSANRSMAFRMEISHRSNTKEFPAGFLLTGEGFFSTIQLNNNGL